METAQDVVDFDFEYVAQGRLAIYKNAIVQPVLFFNTRKLRETQLSSNTWGDRVFKHTVLLLTVRIDFSKQKHANERNKIQKNTVTKRAM